MPSKTPYSLLKPQNDDEFKLGMDDLDEDHDENVFLLQELRSAAASKDVVNNKNFIKDQKNGAGGGTNLRSRGSWKNFGAPNSAADRAGSGNGQRSSSTGPSGNGPAGGAGDSSTQNNLVFIERKIRKDDSLRNLALQYGISVQDLKRVNGLLSDQEFYGKDVIKIPVSRYSVHNFRDDKLADEIYADVPSTSRGSSLPPGNNEFVDLNLDSISPTKNLGADSTEAKITSVSSSPDKFLQNLDENLSKVKKSQEEIERKSKENSATGQQDGGPGEEFLDDRDVFAAAARNWSMRRSWWQRNVTHFVIVVLLIFLVIVIPVFIILYKIVNAVEGQNEPND